DLALDHLRIDGPADIAGRPGAPHVAFASRFVDLDIDRGGVEDEGADLREGQADHGGALGIDSLLIEYPTVAADDRPAGGPMRGAGNDSEADIALRNALYGDEAALHEFEILGLAFENFRGLILDLALHFGGGADHRRAGHVGDAARGGSPIVR